MWNNVVTHTVNNKNIPPKKGLKFKAEWNKNEWFLGFYFGEDRGQSGRHRFKISDSAKGQREFGHLYHIAQMWDKREKRGKGTWNLSLVNIETLVLLFTTIYPWWLTGDWKVPSFI